jgi:hypothetical protein
VAYGSNYVAGGWKDNSIEMLSPGSVQWQVIGSLPEVKWLADAAILGDKEYLVYGNDTKRVFATEIGVPKDIYIRDPQ